MVFAMQFRFLRFHWVLFCCLCPSIAMAQPGTTMPFENEPGLLGRHFLQGQFIMLQTPEHMRSIDSTMTGFTTTLNVPTPWNEMLPATIGQDLFVSGMELNYGGVGGFGGTLANVDAQFRSVGAGLTTYLYLTHDIRPFIQLGVAYDAATIRLASGGFGFRDTDLDGRLLVNPGVELDLTDQVALRTTFGLDTKGGFDKTTYRVELIGWPTEWLFVRGGVAGDVEGDSVGGLIGGGIAW